MSVYKSLYEWQKPFIDKLRDKGFFEYDDKKTSWMFFLKVGIGKTKLMMSMAELHNSDCVIISAMNNKATEEEDIDGSFAQEALLAGYKPFFLHRMKIHKPRKTNRRSNKITQRDIDDAYMKSFEDAIKRKDKIAFIANHDALTSKLGWHIFNILAGGNSFKLQSDIKKEGIIEPYKNITWIYDEVHTLKRPSSITSRLVYEMLYSSRVPKLKTRFRNNYFKQNIKHFYGGTGTPISKGYEDLFQLLRIAGIKKSINEFEDEYCVIKYEEERGRQVPKIEDYKNIDALLDLVDANAWFAKTENYYPFMPERFETIIKVPKGYGYNLMANPSKKNIHYKVFDDYIADTPALFKLRLRQLASGYMGNADDHDYYNDNKQVYFQQLIENNEDDYVVFYNYTPELWLLVLAAEEANYAVDIYNGFIKDLTYHNMSDKEWLKLKSKKGYKGRLLIANVASGSAGKNWQKYKSCIIFALPDTYKDLEQEIGRIERTGQKSPYVYVLLMITQNSVEENIYKTLLQRKDYTDTLFELDYIYKE